MTVQFEPTSLLLAGVPGQDGSPGLWESASLAHWNGVEANAAFDVPEQLSAPPIVVADDGSSLTVRGADAEIELSAEGGGEEAAGEEKAESEESQESAEQAEAEEEEEE